MRNPTSEVGRAVAADGKRPWPSVLRLAAQMVDPAKLLHPTPDTWPMYNGDYSGRRFSPLAKINTSNVDSLSLAWVYRISAGESGGAIKSTPVLLDGVLYFTVPDHVWAIDARDGREVWSFTWQSQGRHSHRQPRRGRVRQLALFRNAGLQSGVAESERRQGALAQARLRSGSVLLRIHRAAGDQEPRDYRGERRRSGHSGLYRIPRSRDRARCNGAGTRIPTPATPRQRPGRTSTP